MRVLVVALCGVFVLSTPAVAQYMTGNDLVRLMKELEKEHTENWFDAGVFSGFVIGVYDSKRFALSQDGRISSMIQVCSIVANYLKKHPESWHRPAHLLVLHALQEAYPSQTRRARPAKEDKEGHK